MVRLTSQDDRLCARSMTSLRRRNALLAEALAATRQAIIVPTAKGTMLLCTEPARRFLARYFHPANPNPRQLPRQFRLWLRRQEPPGSGRGLSSWPHQPLVVEGKQGRLIVELLPSLVTGRRILRLKEQAADFSAELLQRQLCLTPRLAEVLFWVSQGKMNSGIAILLQLSTATVEKHLEHIMAALKVETRTAAAHCAYEVLNLDPIHP